MSSKVINVVIKPNTPLTQSSPPAFFDPLGAADAVQALYANVFSIVSNINNFSNSTILGLNANNELVSSKAIKNYVDISITNNPSRSAGNGLSSNTTAYQIISTNGLISNSSGLYLNTNNGLITNSTGTFILANTGIIANSTGTFVDTAYISTLTMASNVVANIGIISNTNGLFVNAAYIATITSNNSIGAQPASFYLLDGKDLDG